MKKLFCRQRKRLGHKTRKLISRHGTVGASSLFGTDSEELKMISRALGEIPLVGFFANGEISHKRLYGYTGVLPVFL